MRLLPLLLAIVVAGAAAEAATLAAGRIALGSHGSNLVTSPDGKRVVFLRATGGKGIEDCAADATTTKAVELWTANTDGSGARRLLALKSDPDPGKSLCAFDNAQFSSSGQLLYFETPAWATSGAIHVYDFRTNRERLFLPGNGLQVLARCKNAKYRDDVIVGQHRYFVFSGSYDWSFLFTPDGKEVGPLGEGDVSFDIADACG